MKFNNTNIPARPYAPTDYSKQPSGQNPFGYGMQRTAGQTAPQTPAQGYNANFMAGAQVGQLQRPQWGYGPQPQAPQNAPVYTGGSPTFNENQPLGSSQGASPYSAGYTPLQYTGGNDGAAQDAFIQQQHAAYQAWLASQQGQQWAQQQPAGSQWFGQPVNPGPPTAPKVASYSPQQGWGMYAPAPNTGLRNGGSPSYTPEPKVGY